MMKRYGRSLLLGISILAGCGGGGGGGASSLTSPNPASQEVNGAANVVTLSVGPGPAASNGGTFNIPYASVTICQPGTTSCATINNVLVDTGSTGLRIFASALAAANLSLPLLTDPLDSPNTLAECLPFADGYTWGPLATAKVEIGGETANSISINIIDDNGSYTPGVPSACTSLTAPTSLNSIIAFSANGVLGVGLFAQDCGSQCADCATIGGGCTAQSDFYYSCNANSNTCVSTSVALALQAANPVGAFSVDNNGVIMQLPSLAVLGAASAQGSLTFGIGTQSNNGLGSAVVLSTDDTGSFNTTFNGQTLSRGFIDSGSNAFFFDDSSLPACPGSGGHASYFYCPSSTQSLSAINEGRDADGNPMGVNSTVSFQIANLDTIPSTQYAIAEIGHTASTGSGTNTLNGDFDFGLTFFYGRRVYTAIQSAVAGSAVGPFYAY